MVVTFFLHFPFYVLYICVYIYIFFNFRKMSSDLSAVFCKLVQFPIDERERRLWEFSNFDIVLFGLFFK